MNRHQALVRDFHCSFDLPAPQGYSPDTLRGELGISLLREEVEEFAKAVHDSDRLGVIDALVDILYIAYGRIVELGLDIDPFFDAVHKANMDKLGPDGKPAYRSDGKVLKPQHWKPPNLERVLIREQIHEQGEPCDLGPQICMRCPG